MRIFLTGATGYVGSAIAHELQAAGHAVLGLARNGQSVERLKQAGCEVHRGDLDDPAALSAAAMRCDSTIHTAFGHDFSRYEESAATDQRVVSGIAEALAGSDKPFLAVSVTSLLAPGRTGTEEDAPRSDEVPRAASERTVIASAMRGVRAGVVRIPPTIHDAGDRGFVPALIDIARKTGVAAYVDEGRNRWPAVARRDVARLFRLAVEAGETGAVFHAVAGEGVAMRAIAQAIGEGLDVPVRSIRQEEAQGHFGWMARFVGIDNPTSSVLTRDRLGWMPRENSLLSDLRERGYFAEQGVGA